MAGRQFHHRFGGRRAAVAAVMTIALTLATPLSAGLLTTDRTVPNFNFVGAEVDYFPDPETLALSPDSAFAFTATDPDLGYAHSQTSHDTLRGSLHIVLNASNYGNFLGSDFNVFGTLPVNAAATEATLLTRSISALKPDSKPGALEFLIDRQLIVGRLASRYRGVGVFMLVPGVDEMTWVQGFADGASTMELLDAEDTGAAGASFAR